MPWYAMIAYRFGHRDCSVIIFMAPEPSSWLPDGSPVLRTKSTGSSASRTDSPIASKLPMLQPWPGSLLHQRQVSRLPGHSLMQGLPRPRSRKADCAIIPAQCGWIISSRLDDMKARHFLSQATHPDHSGTRWRSTTPERPLSWSNERAPAIRARIPSRKSASRAEGSPSPPSSWITA